jgi:hypothetical protein
MDFHAVSDAFVQGHWRVVNGTLLAPRQTLVRIAVGSAAADCARAPLSRPVGSPLVFEPGVTSSVGERRAHRYAAGVVSAVRRQPVQSPLSWSGATTPTMIRKRNAAPVDLER